MSHEDLIARARTRAKYLRLGGDESSKAHAEFISALADALEEDERLIREQQEQVIQWAERQMERGG